MVLFGNCKYACLRCIRGHRSSSCEHKDRILLQVRKPGRKSRTETKSRYALVWKEPSPTIENKTMENDYKLVKVPDVTKLNDYEVKMSQTSDLEPGENDLVVTENYVFIHVGDNMFRREPRSGHWDDIKKPKAKTSTCGKCTPSNKPDNSSCDSSQSSMEPCNETPEQIEVASKVRGFSTQPKDLRNPLDTLPRPKSHQIEKSRRPLQALVPQISVPVSANDSDHTDSNDFSTGKELLTPKAELETLDADFDSVLFGSNQQPMLIGPMQFQHDIQTRQSTIFNELGITEEEAHQIWPGSEGSTFQDFSVAAQCVLPGQCQCGDDCACSDCFEHKISREAKPKYVTQKTGSPVHIIHDV